MSDLTRKAAYVLAAAKERIKNNFNEGENMSDLFNSVCITSVAPTVSSAFGMNAVGTESENPVLSALIEKKLFGRKPDRAFLYNPDAVALWLFQKYTPKFKDALLCSDIALPMLSVMPSVTPVCFASMYTGVMPEVHGIRAYKKPVLKICSSVCALAVIFNVLLPLKYPLNTDDIDTKNIAGDNATNVNSASGICIQL